MLDPGASSSPDVIHAVVGLTLLAMIFAAKHLLADFLIQTTWMARGKERATGWFLPLAVHVACHGVLTLLIALAVAPRLWWLALVDFVIHIVVDRAKTLVSLKGAWRVEQPQFWWLLGFDQFLHQLTNVGLAAALVIG